MHEYSSDAPDRTRAPLALAGIAILFAYGGSLLRERLHFDPPWWLWLEPPSLAGLYWLLHSGFDRWLWRMRVFGWRASAVRDLRGTWVGTLTSSHAKERHVPVVLWIDQTWTRLRVRTATEQSTSRSLSAAVLTDDAAEPGLSYQYVNDPKAFAAVPGMESHRGTASFVFSSEEDSLEGEYYTGRGRENYGAIRLRRISGRLLPRGTALQRISDGVQLPASVG